LIILLAGVACSMAIAVFAGLMLLAAVVTSVFSGIHLHAFPNK